MRTDLRAGSDARTESDDVTARTERDDAAARTESDRSDAECDDATPVSRVARMLRLLKLAATTLAALVGVAKAIGLL